MKIESLQISNILSFQYYEDISQAPKITFDDGLNILIGQNGSGKSTALEVINFLFKRVLFVPIGVNHDFYSRKSTIAAPERRQIISEYSNNSYNSFRLDPNWDYENKPQKIRIVIIMDDVDKRNIEILEANKHKLQGLYQSYSQNTGLNFTLGQDKITCDVNLNKNDKTFSMPAPGIAHDGSYRYLTKYNLYKELIDFYNKENQDDLIEALHEPFTLIGGYRNYNSYTSAVTLRDQSALQQIQNIKQTEDIKSTNTNENAEPSIFSLVRLRIAERHYELFPTNLTNEECEQRANQEPFLLAINEKLKLVNLKVQIKLLNQRTWEYSFSFLDTKRNRILNDINSLSAGQKSIVHLIFEAYGRGNLKGGLVIIDEPEIHLHYQFQHAYLKIIEKLNIEQGCQYILVTHSESLINSNTISKVKRFALNENSYTEVKSPGIHGDQNTLIKILDNTRSTYAFFAKKVILVEGDSDRYFFKAVFEILQPELSQEIAILDIGGKGNYEKWKEFFEGFGLQVYYIGDFDNVFTLKFGGSTLIPNTDKEAIENALRQEKLNALTADQKNDFKHFYDNLIADTNFLTSPSKDLWNPLLDKFKNFIKISNAEIAIRARANHVDIINRIEEKYSENVFILKIGSIEAYIGGPHAKLNHVVSFCDTSLEGWLSLTSEEVIELKNIVSIISS